MSYAHRRKWSQFVRWSKTENRALLSPAQLIVIDEGLNQVEVSLERIILQNIFCHYPEKTIVYITHRVQNFDLFPRLIEMQQGTIIRDLKKKTCST